MTLERARGALLGTFVGDALGMPYEGCRAGTAPRPLEMVEARLGRGTYTDDSQMMIALAESLLACGRVEPEHLASAFLDAYDPQRGYGSGTVEVLSRWRAGEPVDAAAERLFGASGGSFGNGAAMRIAPVAVMFASDTERLLHEARASARLTHTHPVGIEAAVAQAAAVGAALTGGDPLAAPTEALRGGEVEERLAEAAKHVEDRISPIETAKLLGNSSAGHESVPAAIYSAAAHSGFEEPVTFAIACGGDTDTIGAMAGAIAGARHGLGAIPTRWLEALEEGDRGRSYVDDLAQRLWECGS
ncbi:MAG TPA: ADP-ribosylglycohydrolase family protein [Gaiellaceae bacterium]|nr:ADP-ribosylglycohydrolase family protein [Gaiellaceae bacterium]